MFMSPAPLSFIGKIGKKGRQKMDALLLNPEDQVATAVRELRAGQIAQISSGETVQELKILENIPYGHKVAVQDILKGMEVRKYGEVIGRASCEIRSGTHAHVQNIESLRGRGDWKKEDPNGTD